MSPSRAAAASPFLLGAALAAVAFGASGGTELGRTSVVELLLVIAGAVALAYALLQWREGRMYGAPAVLLFCLLVGITGLSVIWSIAPELSFIEAGRTFAYLAVFAAAVAAARLVPRAAPALVTALLLATSAVVLYGLLSRVFPGVLAKNVVYARIGAPYGYWNALATTAAMMVPAALWLGSRRGARLATSTLAYPAMGIAILAILLTQSRGALLAALVGAGLWFALVSPLRLRSLPVLVVPAILAAPVAAWALSKDAFTKNLEPLSARKDVAGEFALLLFLMLVLIAAAGLALGYARLRTAPPPRLRRQVGIASIAALCAVPFVVLVALAFSDRGIGGTVSDRFHDLTSETASPPRGASRLTASSSSRGRYWRQAGHVFADRPWIGTGAGTFGIARLRYRKDQLVSRHAHGYIPQALADTGLLGLFATLAVLIAWLVAAGRTTALYPRLRERGPPARRDWHAERIAMAALAFVVVVFGVQSAIDWTWFVPGPAVMALVAAGYVAGRGPLPDAAAPTPEPPASGRVGPLGVRVPAFDRGRAIPAAAVLVTALLCAWAIWQPEASDRASTKALDLADEGNLGAALAKANDAHDANPLSPRPLLVKATIQEGMGRRGDALHTLQKAVLDFPGDPQTWLRLSTFQLGSLDRPTDALETLRGAIYLDPRSKAVHSLFLQTRSAERAKQVQEQTRQLKSVQRRARRKAKRR